MPKSQTEISDESLLIAVANGDRAAVSMLYQRHGGQLHRVAFGITRNAALADEALQEGFVGIWNTANGFDKRRGTAIGWIIRVIRFKAIDLVRDQARQNRNVDALALEPREETEAPQAENNILGQQEQRRLRACLGGLPSDRRTLIEASFLRGMTHAEVAEAAGQPLGTVKSSIRRGLLALRDCLEQDDTAAAQEVSA